jgi:hypothetical protein
MSLTRRLAAGLPAAGMTLFAALALSGTPASADESAVRAAQPAATQPACAGNARDCQTGYGADAETPGDAGSGPAATTPGTVPGGGHTRGNPGGYGSVSPTTVPPTVPTTPPTTSPTGYTDTVPPSGVSPTTVSPSPSRPSGVSPAHTLPVTGAPSAGTVGAGALLIAAGGFALWAGRRRRTA